MDKGILRVRPKHGYLICISSAKIPLCKLISHPFQTRIADSSGDKTKRPLTRSLFDFQELKDFLDDADQGFIYFSLGGNVKSKDLRGQTMTNIVEALKELPYKVLWKFEADELPGKPENIKLIKWAPQQDILSEYRVGRFRFLYGGLLARARGTRQGVEG